MEINYWAVLVCGIISMILGSIWFGPLFGKTWSKICRIDALTEAERKKMQKAAGPLYVISFILSLFQAFVLAYYISIWRQSSGVDHAVWIWAAFIIPTVAAGAMWNNDSKEISWARFGIQAGYYLVLFVAYGLVLGAWR